MYLVHLHELIIAFCHLRYNQANFMKHCNIPGYLPLPVIYWNIKIKVIPHYLLQVQRKLHWEEEKQKQVKKRAHCHGNSEKQWWHLPLITFSSVQFSLSVVSDSLRPHESQHARPPCPSPTPGVHSNSRPSSQWIYILLLLHILFLSFTHRSLLSLFSAVFFGFIPIFATFWAYYAIFHLGLSTEIISSASAKPLEFPLITVYFSLPQNVFTWLLFLKDIFTAHILLA